MNNSITVGDYVICTKPYDGYAVGDYIQKPFNDVPRPTLLKDIITLVSEELGVSEDDVKKEMARPEGLSSVLSMVEDLFVAKLRRSNQ